MEAVLWDAERGAWFDYNLVRQSRHTEFYPSNLAPLWAQCYSQPEMAEKAVQYLKVGGNRWLCLSQHTLFLSLSLLNKKKKRDIEPKPPPILVYT